MGSKSTKNSTIKNNDRKTSLIAAKNQDDKRYFGSTGDQELENSARLYNVPYELALNLRQKYMMYCIKSKRVTLTNFILLYREFVNTNATESEIERAFYHYKSGKHDGLSFSDLLRAIFTQWTIYYTQEKEKIIRIPPTNYYTNTKLIPSHRESAPIEPFYQLKSTYDTQSDDGFVEDELPRRRYSYEEPRRGTRRSRSSSRSTKIYRTRSSTSSTRTRIKKITILIPKDPKKPIIKWIKTIPESDNE